MWKAFLSLLIFFLLCVIYDAYLEIESLSERAAFLNDQLSQCETRRSPSNNPR